MRKGRFTGDRSVLARTGNGEVHHRDSSPQRHRGRRELCVLCVSVVNRIRAMKRAALLVTLLALLALPAQAAPPAPSEFLKMNVGADRVLADYRQIASYFH